MLPLLLAIAWTLLLRLPTRIIAGRENQRIDGAHTTANASDEAHARAVAAAAVEQPAERLQLLVSSPVYQLRWRRRMEEEDRGEKVCVHCCRRSPPPRYD